MADICFCIGSTKQGSFHLELKLSDGFESTVKAMHRTHSDWHWLCHFYWILDANMVNTSLWKVLVSLFLF